MIAVQQTATRYDLSFPDFDPKARETWAAIRDVKALPGRMFDPTAKVWRIPLSASVEVRQLAEKYGAQIEELAIEAGYPADAAHRIAQLEAQLATMVADDPPRYDELAAMRAARDVAVASGHRLADEVAALRADVERLTRVLRTEKDAAGKAPRKVSAPRKARSTAPSGPDGTPYAVPTPRPTAKNDHAACTGHYKLAGGPIGSRALPGTWWPDPVLCTRPAPEQDWPSDLVGAAVLDTAAAIRASTAAAARKGN